MEFPGDLKYSKEHEWIRIEGKVATIGITDFAQDQLGDVVMVEFPNEGAILTKDETFGVVESVKSVSDVFAPISGKVLETNEPLADSPGIINEDCYNEGWIIKMEITDPKQVDELLTVDQYKAYLAEQG
ncbi:glycine cleavage system protein GcvH [bacterium]|nr:glycine cleavage system protein GcvH [bacterium]